MGERVILIRFITRPPESVIRAVSILLHPHDDGGIAPQIFQVVKVPRPGVKEVNDHIPVIEQHPARGCFAFYAQRAFPVLLHSFFDLVHNRFRLAFAFRRGDDEKVGYGRYLASIKQDNV